MTSPIDPAIAILGGFVDAMKLAFNPDDAVAAPKGGGSKNVRLFAGEGALPPSLIVSAGRGQCAEPLLWVRLALRYLSRDSQFPAVFEGATLCDDGDINPALAIEVGVGRCSTMDAEPEWDTLADEADISLDDSFRLTLAMNLARDRLTQQNHITAFATNTVVPYGPEGGTVSWTGMAHAQYREKGC